MHLVLPIICIGLIVLVIVYSVINRYDPHV